jgi:UDP-N-acetylmuramyl pentapeptide phosphotransferase/UDP-N-acetylglucosamine-1-phosphate transferase
VGSVAICWKPLAVFFIVAVTNIYNFMDGLDGLAAGHSCIVLASWIAFGSIYSIGQFESFICLSLLIPLVGFLLCNWHPARAFMGDVGSTFIGFTFACLALIQLGEVPRIVNFSAYLLLMMPFLFDASFTIISRYLRGEKWYRPHRLHIFQRIYDQGVSQSFIVTVYLGITAYMGCMVLLSHLQILTSTTIGGALCLTPYLLLYSWMWRLEQGAECGVQVEPISS